MTREEIEILNKPITEADRDKHAIGILKDISRHYQLQAGGFQFALHRAIKALEERIQKSEVSE